MAPPGLKKTTITTAVAGSIGGKDLSVSAKFGEKSN